MLLCVKECNVHFIHVPVHVIHTKNLYSTITLFTLQIALCLFAYMCFAPDLHRENMFYLYKDMYPAIYNG